MPAATAGQGSPTGSTLVQPLLPRRALAGPAWPGTSLGQLGGRGLTRKAEGPPRSDRFGQRLAARHREALRTPAHLQFEARLKPGALRRSKDTPTTAARERHLSGSFSKPPW